MARLNIIRRRKAKTRGGAPARSFGPEQLLRRSIMNCMLWEGEFYEDGVTIADRIQALVPKVAPETVARIGIDACEKSKLRHAPLCSCALWRLPKSIARWSRRRWSASFSVPTR